MSRLVITGATGNVGGLVAQQLSDDGHDIHLVVRDAARAPSLPSATVQEADFGSAESLAAALRPGDTVFMVSLPTGDRMPLQRSFIEAAQRAEVGRIVYLSFMQPSPTAVFEHARSHYETEELLKQSGIDWTFVRNGMYADDLPEWFDRDGIAHMPVGDSLISYTYRLELAEAIAVIMTGADHAGRTYNITGAKAVTLAEVADVLTSVTGCTYRFAPDSREDYAARCRAEGWSEELVGWELSECDAQVAGELDDVTDDYRTLTGKEPLPLGEVLSRMTDRLPLTKA